MMAARTMAMRLPVRMGAPSVARVAAAPAARTLATSSRATPLLAARAQQLDASVSWRQQQRNYAAGGGLSHQEIQNRIFEVLKSFEKVDPSKVSTSSTFTKDLGLDSLDAVEVVMAIEEEFAIEIPDAEADAITSVQQAIDYVAKTPSAH